MRVGSPEQSGKTSWTMPVPLQNATVNVSNRNPQVANLNLRLPSSPTGQPCAFSPTVIRSE